MEPEGDGYHWDLNNYSGLPAYLVGFKIRVAQGQIWSKFENQDSDVCSFYKCISPLE